MRSVVQLLPPLVTWAGLSVISRPAGPSHTSELCRPTRASHSPVGCGRPEHRGALIRAAPQAGWRSRTGRQREAALPTHSPASQAAQHKHQTSSPSSLSSLASCTTQTPNQLSQLTLQPRKLYNTNTRPALPELTLQPRKLYNTNTRPALPTHSPASQAVQHKHQTSSPKSLSSLASCTTQTPDQLSQSSLASLASCTTQTPDQLSQLTLQPRKLYNTNTRLALPTHSPASQAVQHKHQTCRSKWNGERIVNRDDFAKW